MYKNWRCHTQNRQIITVIIMNHLKTRKVILSKHHHHHHHQDDQQRKENHAEETYRLRFDKEYMHTNIYVYIHIFMYKCLYIGLIEKKIN
jgi:hypothetical protein